MLEKRMFLVIYMIIGYFISTYSSQVDRCSKWNNSSPKHIFGLENGTATNNINGLNLSFSSGLDILPNTDEIVLLDDNNHRILVLNQPSNSTLFAILSDSSNLTNRSTIFNSPSAISHDQNNSIYIVDTWVKQFTRISYPLQYGENATLMNKSLPWLSNQPNNNTVRGLCVDPIDGSILISDTSGHRIIRYDTNSSENVTYAGNGTRGSTSIQLNSPASIAMNNNRTLFVNDADNRRIQMFPFNSTNATTLSTFTDNYTRLSLYSSDILVFNTKTEVHLFNLTSNSSRCILGCTNSSQLNDTRSAVITKNGTLFLTESNRLISFSMYSECSEETSTVMTTQPSSDPLSTTKSTSTEKARLETSTVMTTESLSDPVSRAKDSSSFIPPTCRPGKFGINCSANDNICDVNQPCLNSGSCLLNDSHPLGYDCKCQEGFEGNRCEDDQRPCKSFTCTPPQGECETISNIRYKCHCNPGYEGNQCERMVNYCANVTCQNRGVCSTQLLNYTCQCLPGFYGRYCEQAETSGVIRGYVRKSVGFVAIIMLASVVGLIVVMDILKYGFGIDPVKTDRDALKKKRMGEEKKKKKKNQRPKVAYRFEYIN